jgi:hypothetical protein
MTDLIQTLTDIHLKNSKKIKYSLLKVSDYRQTFNKSEDPECDICYEHISNKVFVCAEPCSKTFHMACLESMIEHLEDDADNEGKEDACYRCCYCRREFDINQYELSIFVQELLRVKSHGYHIGNAIQSATLRAITYEDDYIDEYRYDVYLPVDSSFIKTPKQSKRGAFKQKQKHLRSHLNVSKKRMPLGRR